MSTILIVDDHEQNRYLLRTMLAASGDEVLEAANGAEALELARRTRPDLIISDILMPQMDGFALCRECKRDEQLRDIPFVFYTATYTDPRDEALALQLGAARFIVKPVESEDFLAILREVLQAHAAGQVAAPAAPAGRRDGLLPAVQRSPDPQTGRQDARPGPAQPRIWPRAKDASAVWPRTRRT